MPDSYTDWIYGALRRVGLTQQDVERSLKIAKGELSRMLRRHRPAGVERVQQIVDLLTAEAQRRGITLAPFPPPRSDGGVYPSAGHGEMMTDWGTVGEPLASYDVPVVSSAPGGPGAGARGRTTDTTDTTHTTDTTDTTGQPPGAALDHGPTGAGPRYRWYRSYAYGTIGDPTDAERAPRHYVGRLVRDDEAAMIGEAGWAVTLTGNELSNWIAGGGPLGPGWALYCNPDLARDVPREVWEGQLVIARDLTGRLLAGVLRRAAVGDGWLLSTDSTSLRQQVVTRVAQVYGPVVLYQPPSHLTAQRSEPPLDEPLPSPARYSGPVPSALPPAQPSESSPERDERTSRAG